MQSHTARDTNHGAGVRHLVRPFFTIAAKRSPAMRSSPCVLLGLALACASPALAAETVSIPINGVRIQNNLAQSRNSGTQTINAAYRYSMRFSSDTTASGSGGILAALYPSPTPLATIMNDLAPGTDPLAPQSATNPSGMLPASLPTQTINQTSVLSGINVTFGMTINAGADAAGVCSFSLSSVVISPSILVGSLLINQGSIIVSTHCIADLTLDQAVTIDDLLAFLGYFESGNVAGDMNRDDAITIDDLLVMLENFEDGC